MPTYSFECELDGFFERSFPMSEIKEEIQCPICDGKAFRRYTVPPAVVFKGPGFYKTDSKR